MTDLDLPDATALRGAAETLLVPLACRARASREKLVDRFADPTAEALCSRFAIDLGRYASGHALVRGVVHRGRWFDARIARFLASRPEATVLSLGSGLNTMYERLRDRVPEGSWRWIDSDLEAVVRLRRAVMADDPRRATLVFDAAGGDLPDHPWIGAAEELLVVSEAALIYVGEAEVAAFFRRLAAFGRARRHCGIVFDWCSPEMVRHSRANPGLKALRDEGVVFVSALRRAGDIAAYDPAWRIVAESSASMAHASVGSALFDGLFRLATRGRRFYGLAEAELAGSAGRRPQA